MNRDDLEGLLLEIDSYVEGLFAPPDPALESALRRSREAGLPEIHVSPNEGKLLRLQGDQRTTFGEGAGQVDGAVTAERPHL